MRSSHYLVFSRPRSTIPKSAAPPNYDRWSNSHQGLAADVGARRFKCLVGDFIEDIVIDLVEFGVGVGAVVHGDYPSSLAKRCSSSGSLATLAAIRRASSRVSRCAAAQSGVRDVFGHPGFTERRAVKETQGANDLVYGLHSEAARTKV